MYRLVARRSTKITTRRRSLSLEVSECQRCIEWRSAEDALSRMSYYCSLMTASAPHLDSSEADNAQTLMYVRPFIICHLAHAIECQSSPGLPQDFSVILFVFVSTRYLLTWEISGKNCRRMPIVLLLLRAASLSASAITSRSRACKKVSHWPRRTTTRVEIQLPDCPATRWQIYVWYRYQSVRYHFPRWLRK